MRITTTIKGSRIGTYDILRGVRKVEEIINEANDNYPTDLVVELSAQYKDKNRASKDVFSAKVTVVE